MDDPGRCPGQGGAASRAKGLGQGVQGGRTQHTTTHNNHTTKNPQHTTNSTQHTTNNTQPTTNQPTDQATNHPTNQPTNHPTTQPTTQPPTHPPNEPTNEPHNFLIKRFLNVVQGRFFSSGRKSFFLSVVYGRFFSIGFFFRVGCPPQAFFTFPRLRQRPLSALPRPAPSAPGAWTLRPTTPPSPPAPPEFHQTSVVERARFP